MANPVLSRNPKSNEKPPTPEEQKAAETMKPLDLEGLPTMNIEALDQLLPALLEISIRQARAEGQPDLAQALQSLQLSLQVKAEQKISLPPSGSSDT